MADGAGPLVDGASPEVAWTFHRGLDLGGGIVFDLLEVDAPKVLAGLEATREKWSGYALRILDAPKGGGKTYALGQLAGERATCITDRKALASQNAKGFGGEFRRDPGSSRQAIRGQAERARRFSCTLHTTPRLYNRDMSADTLVVDEAIHVLGTLATGAELRGRRRGVVDAAFLSAIRRCREGWFAQAGWTEEDVRSMVRTVERAGRNDRVLLVVVRTPERRGKAIEVPSVEALRDATLGAAAQGPVVYASTSRKSGERLLQAAIKYGFDPLLVSGRTLHTLRVQRWLADPRADVEPFVILSPTVVSGLSIHRLTDGSAAYPRVFMELRTWPGGLSLDDALQMVARVRGEPELMWWASSSVVGGRSADEHYADEEAAATASATVLGVEARPGTGLDELVAARSAADEASLGPTPRAAFAEGLARDGWNVTRCEPEPATTERRAWWAEVKEWASAAYIQDLAAEGRGPVDQQTVAARLVELGLPKTTGALSEAALAGVEWLEGESPGRSPVDLLVALLAPEDARVADAAALATFVARRDLPHTLLQVELVRALLRAANVDFARLVRGGGIEVRSTDLQGFTSAAWRFHDAMARLLGIQAPKGKGGAIRAFGTLLGRLGAVKAGSRRPAEAGRVRTYGFRLSPIALDAVVRRVGDVPVPTGLDGTVFNRTAADVLRARVPMRASSAVVEQLPALKERQAATSDESERARLAGVIRIIEKAAAAVTAGAPSPTDWQLSAKRHRRGDSGRIQLMDEPLQSIPRSLRDYITPELPGDVLVSGDYRSCHVPVAGARTGDAGIVALLKAEDAYADLAGRFLADVEDGRGKMKAALLAMLSAAGAWKVGQIVGNEKKGRAIHGALTAELPGLGRCFEEARRLQAAPGTTAEVPTLTGASRTIMKRAGPHGWKRLASAMWMGPESEALDNVLAALPVGARLAVPMHDGLLVCCAKEDAERVARELREVMVTGARKAGFEAGVKVGIGETWGAAERGAR